MKVFDFNIKIFENEWIFFKTKFTNSRQHHEIFIVPRVTPIP